MMSSRILKYGAGLIVAAAILAACAPKPRQETTRRNLAYLYNPSRTPIHPEFTVFHENLVRSRLYVKVYTSELLFNSANSAGTYQSKLRIRYELKELIDGKESETVSDSLTTSFTLEKEEAKDIFIAYIALNTEEPKQYMLTVHMTDMLRNRGTVNYIRIDRSTIHTAQNYLVIDDYSGFPHFGNVFASDEVFHIRYDRTDIDSVYIKFYRNNFPLPRPPITNLSSPRPGYTPDSLYVSAYSDTASYMLPREGMYHIQADPTQPDGLTLFNFGEDFPRVVTTENMVGPLAYLSSSVEFNDLANQANLKLAVDNFWLQAGGNVQTAREMIRVYYNRVFLANYFFTSYKEGWKTDRGMMFIVYGPPNLLTRRDDAEIWVYYRKKNRESLQFTFSRRDNPYTQNDYLLERNFVNSMWTQAVQDWRGGKIFNTESN